MADFDPLPRLILDHIIIGLAEKGVSLSPEAERDLLVRVARNTRTRKVDADLRAQALRNADTVVEILARQGRFAPVQQFALEASVRGLCPNFWPFC